MQNDILNVFSVENGFKVEMRTSLDQYDDKIEGKCILLCNMRFRFHILFVQ